MTLRACMYTQRATLFASRMILFIIRLFSETILISKNIQNTSSWHAVPVSSEHDFFLKKGIKKIPIRLGEVTYGTKRWQFICQFKKKLSWCLVLNKVKHVLSSLIREAKLAAKGRWLLNTGVIQNKF